jgi:hypothetical protein
VLVGALAAAGALTVIGLNVSTVVGASSHGRTVEYWVAAVPVTWNITPNGRDAIMGEDVATAQSVLQTVVFRRYTPGWKKPMANAAPSSADG